MPDFLPEKRLKRFALLKLIAGTWKANPAIYKLAPDKAATFAALVNDAVSADKEARASHNEARGRTKRAKTADDKAVDALRPLVAQMRVNRAISNADLARIGIRRPKRTRTRHGPPRTAPAPSIARLDSGSIKLNCHNRIGSRAKPKGVAFFQVSLQDADTPLDNPERGQMSIHSRTPVRVKTGRPGRKRLRARWVSTRGDPYDGPWSHALEFNSA